MSSRETQVLWQRVIRARAVLAQQRRLPVNGGCADARDELLEALEAYVASLQRQGRPTPYALRDQLQLQRLTRSADRYQRYGTGDRRPG